MEAVIGMYFGLMGIRERRVNHWCTLLARITINTLESPDSIYETKLLTSYTPSWNDLFKRIKRCTSFYSTYSLQWFIWNELFSTWAYKNSGVVSCKSNCQILHFKTPNIFIVFTNYVSHTKKLSKGRWRIYNISDDELVINDIGHVYN